MIEKLSEKRELLGNYQFHVVQDGVFQDEGDLWHVVISPNRRIERRGQVYDVLNDVEEEIEAEHSINVMIVPVKPEQENSASIGAS